MNKSEQKTYNKLLAENKFLREQLDKHMTVYREQLYEIVELKTWRDNIRAIAAELEAHTSA